jgi:hypothetical protein
MVIEAATVETLSWIGCVRHPQEHDIEFFSENCAVAE